jgi:tripartite-type tricarboxylate transporter receptor subunit TctC
VQHRASQQSSGGEIQLTFNSILPAMPHIRSGRVRVLGVSSTQPTAVLPDAPTIAEAGLPGYELNRGTAFSYRGEPRRQS